MRIIGRQIEKDRLEAFARLETVLSGASVRQSPHGKRIIFFDEFPWFATPRSDFPAAFGEFRNRCGTVKGDFLLIICGSATFWIIGNLVENTGSPYNRVTGQIFLQPFTLKETEQFFREKQFRVVMAADRRMLYGLRRDRVFSGTAEPE